jgi:hypothetical protein
MRSIVLGIACAFLATACARPAPAPVPNAPTRIDACTMALATALSAEARSHDENTTYLIDVHPSSPCAPDSEALVERLDAMGFDAFPWSAAFAKTWRSRTGRLRFVLPVHGAVHVSLREPFGPSRAAPIEYVVWFEEASGPSSTAYDLGLTWTDGRWLVSKSDVLFVMH